VTGLDLIEKRKILPLPCHPARSLSLCRLSYPDSFSTRNKIEIVL
jgi:hypothetical protein